MPKVPAPFQYPGGKSKAAPLIWEALGDVPNYCEPFAGTLATLLGRPTTPGVETINDRDCYIANFWRAVLTDPDKVARWADWPVNEMDLHARHQWLYSQQERLRRKLYADPLWYDPKVAGWWVWGIGQWIGDGWCNRGHSWRQIPNRRPSGIHSQDSEGIRSWFRALQTRLRHVRVACGQWDRILGRTHTWLNGLTGVLLDPPYRLTMRDPQMYADEDAGLNDRVWTYAVDNGNREDMRIVLCGLEGEYDMPDDWICVRWTGRGGYGNRRADNRNRYKEVLWLSPHCLPVTSGSEQRTPRSRVG